MIADNVSADATLWFEAKSVAVDIVSPWTCAQTVDDVNSNASKPL